jgi:hypothetical protein
VPEYLLGTHRDAVRGVNVKPAERPADAKLFVAPPNGTAENITIQRLKTAEIRQGSTSAGTSGVPFRKAFSHR